MIQVICERPPSSHDYFQKVLEGEGVEGEYHLTIGGRKSPGRIFFKVIFFGMEDLDKASLVENCYFEQRPNCKVCEIQIVFVDLDYTIQQSTIIFHVMQL